MKALAGSCPFNSQVVATKDSVVNDIVCFDNQTLMKLWFDQTRKAKLWHMSYIAIIRLQKKIVCFFSQEICCVFSKI